MRKLLGIVFVLVLLTGCSSIGQNNLDSSDFPTKQQCWSEFEPEQEKNHSAMLNRQIKQFAIFHEQVVTNRQVTLRLFEEFEEHTSAEESVSSSLQDALNKALINGLDKAKSYEQLVSDNWCWFTYLEQGVYQPSIMLGFSLELASALALYDAYVNVLIYANSNEKLRRFLNQEDIGYGKNSDSIQLLIDKAHNKTMLFRLQEQIMFFDQNIELFRALRGEPDIDYLLRSIEQSYSYQNLPKVSLEDYLSKVQTQSAVNIEDNLAEYNRIMVNGVSRTFGNVIGLFESRKGRLYQAPEVTIALEQTLEPGDILLEKTPFRLTDAFIPGYWGHAAIWIGSEAQLKALELWDNPLVIRYQDDISQGRGVAEALRSGVSLSPIADFLNVDDLVVLRNTTMSSEQKREVVILALRQIGKEYDFNYDVETTDKIVCSQLIYLAYPNIQWPTDKVAGRHTISPDNIAYQAVYGKKLQPYLLYIEGERISEDLSQSLRELHEK